MIIHSATFELSNTDWTKCPAPNKPEYAFIGRSNVGKSSLINMMVDRKNLAKTSASPGKTRLINHFLINENWYLTDLPGYGYAKVSKAKKGEFSQIITEYILNRENLINLFLLIDSRLEPQKIDLEFMEWLGEQEVPFSIVFTKLDKLGKSTGAQNIATYKKKLLEFWAELPPVFVTSAELKTGKEELLDYITTLNEEVKDAFKAE